jgi:hypothetical protein
MADGTTAEEMAWIAKAGGETTSVGGETLGGYAASDMTPIHGALARLALALEEIEGRVEGLTRQLDTAMRSDDRVQLAEAMKDPELRTVRNISHLQDLIDELQRRAAGISDALETLSFRIDL